MIIWLLIGVITYFLLKRLAFSVETREWKSVPFEDLISKESWTYGKSILALFIISFLGPIALIVYIILTIICVFSSDIRFKGDHWFNKQSKL